MTSFFNPTCKMKRIIPGRYDLIIFLFSLAIISGPAYTVMDEFSYEGCNDCQSYLSIARGDIDKSPVRRYRVIIPLAAGSIDRVAGNFIERFRPWSTTEDFSLSISFLLINSLLMSLYSVLVYRLTLFYVTTPFAAIISLLSLLTCRWTSFFAGLPLVDSLYLVVTAMVLLGIKGKHNGLLVAAIFIGPWAKEAFIFLAPLIFFFSGIRRSRQVLYFVLSGILVFGFRFFYDQSAGNSFTESLLADTYHFSYIAVSAGRLFSFHGLYEILSVTGIWVLLFIPFFRRKEIRLSVTESIESYIWWYIPIVLLHLFLSTEIARMFYLILPVLVIMYAIIIDNMGIIQKISAVLPNRDTR